MTKIKNSADFRRGYEWLGILTECASNCNNPEKVYAEIENTKRELRSYASRGTAVDVGMGFMCERRIVKDNGIDGYVELVSIPWVFESEGQARDFFKDFLEIHARPSMYDCTGQAFTSWYKLFRRRDQFWVYHSVSFDV